MQDDRPAPSATRNPLVSAHGRQIMFYAASGLLGGMFTCSRCDASGRHPDVIDHVRGCSYRSCDDDAPRPAR